MRTTIARSLVSQLKLDEEIAAIIGEPLTEAEKGPYREASETLTRKGTLTERTYSPLGEIRLDQDVAYATEHGE